MVRSTPSAPPPSALTPTWFQLMLPSPVRAWVAMSAAPSVTAPDTNAWPVGSDQRRCVVAGAAGDATDERADPDVAPVDRFAGHGLVGEFPTASERGAGGDGRSPCSRWPPPTPPEMPPITPPTATWRGSNLPVASPTPADMRGADQDAGADRLATRHEHQPDAERHDADHGEGAPRVFLDRLPRLTEPALLLALADRVVLLLRHRPQPGRVDEVHRDPARRTCTRSPRRSIRAPSSAGRPTGTDGSAGRTHGRRGSSCRRRAARRAGRGGCDPTRRRRSATRSHRR